MDNRLVLLLVAYFVAEMATVPSATPEGGAKPARAPAELVEADRLPVPPGGTAPVRRVLGPWSVVCEHFAEDPPKQLPGAVRSGWCLPDADKMAPIETLLVMVPDPRQTRLSLDFDRYIQTIERSIGAAGYAIDRFWLPWTAERTPTRQGVESAEAEQARHQPGLLWFRSSELNKPKYLAAFLIGETPVAGINQRAFMEAVGYSRMMTGEKGVLRIAGPFSSGGLYSLNRALRNAGVEGVEKKGLERKDVAIVSGSVTGSELKAFAAQWPFRSMASPDNETFARVSAILQANEVALLMESATSYGSQDVPSARKTLSLRFPREMAWLRKAYEESPGLSDSNPEEAAARRTLRGKLETDHVGTDSVPVFSRAQSPLLQEAELLALARRVKEHHVRHMVIFATDILDTTFLARFFRKCCDVRPVIFEPDLYLSRADGFPLVGTLAVNRAILVPDATRNGEVFSSGSVWGLYESIQSLLGGKADGDASALWLSLVGRNGYWPVQRLDEGPAPRWSLHPPRVWQNGILLLTMALLGYCWALYVPHRRGSEFARNRFFWSFAVDGKLGHERRAYVLGTLLSMAAAALMLGLPVVDQDHLELEGWEPITVTGLTSVAVAVVAFAAWRIRLPEPKWLGLTVWSVFAAVIAVWTACVMHGPRAPFFSVRAVHLESGVSPALPLVCLVLALGVWCWGQVLRLRLFHERQPSVPAGAAPDRHWKRSTMKVFRDPMVQGWKTFALLALVVLALAIAAGGGQMLETIEGRLFDLTFRAMLLLVILLIVLALARLSLAWRTARAVLQHVETQPFRDKFKDVGRDYNWYSIFHPGGASINLRPVDRSFECAAELAFVARAKDSLNEELEWLSELDEPRQKFKQQLLPQRFETQQEAVAITAEVHRALCSVAEKLIAKYGDMPRPREANTVRDLIDEFVTLQYVNYFRQIFVLLSYLASFAMTAFVLMVIALNSYPFAQPRSISLWVLGSFLAVGAFTIIIFWQMDRDPVLSRMNNLPADRLDRHFWTLVAQYGALPLLAVVGSQFPEFSGVISRWLGATGDLLK